MEDLIKQNVDIRPSSNNQNDKNQSKGGTNSYKDQIGTAQSTEKKNMFFTRVKDYVKKQEELDKIFKKKENLGWDLKFQNYWGQIARSVEQGEQKANIQISEHFIAHIGQFSKTSKEVVMQIVNELHLENSKRKFERLDLNREKIYEPWLDQDKECYDDNSKTQFF